MHTRKILFCTDFSENSIPARHRAVEYAKAFGAHLSVLHVVNPSPLGYPLFEDRIPVDMGALLDTIQKSVGEELELVVKECGPDLKEVKAYYRVGEAASEIVQFAEEESIDLIVMGTHGWTGLKHLVLGSTAENVVRKANCPVLTVKATTAMK
jgi:nucleotide-binding universal stress UspA family protein